MDPKEEEEAIKRLHETSNYPDDEVPSVRAGWIYPDDVIGPRPGHPWVEWPDEEGVLRRVPLGHLKKFWPDQYQAYLSSHPEARTPSRPSGLRRFWRALAGVFRSSRSSES